ncbi:MAG: hypothetical protein R6V40_03150 [Candidatus Moraniibacteriota bacterium]
MKSSIKKMVSFLTLSLIFVLPFTVGAAFDPGSGLNPGDVDTDQGLSTMTPEEIFNTVIGWLLFILGFLAVLGIIISGVMYVISPNKEGAKNWLMYSIVGLIVALLGYVIVMVVTSLLGV